MVSRSCRCHTQRTQAGENCEAALPQFVGDPDLAKCGLFNGKRNNRILDILRHSVLQHRFLAADLLRCSSPPLS